MLTSVLVAFGTLFYAGAAVVQIYLMKQSAQDSAAQVERLVSAINQSIGESVQANKEALAAALRQNRDALEASILQTKSALQASTEQSRAALQASIDSVRLEQQPVVWVSQQPNKELTAQSDVGQPVSVSVWYENYGRSPAMITAYSADAEIGQGAVRKLHHAPWRAASVLPIGKVDEVNFRSEDYVTQENVDEIRSAGGIAILVGIRYRDVRHRLYESDFCFSTGQDGIVQGCPPSFHLNRMIDCESEQCGE